MPQEFQVLQCFACSTFQVHFVKKSNKWQCKMCNEKQSLKQVFGKGTGQDCRLHVQKLNAMRHTNNEVLATFRHQEHDPQPQQREQTFDSFQQPFQPVTSDSKWSNFLQNELDESSDDEDPFQKALRAGDPQRIRRARAPKKAKQAAPEDANYESCGSSSNKRTGSIYSATAKRHKAEEFKSSNAGISNKPVASASSKWGQFLLNEVDGDISDADVEIWEKPKSSDSPKPTEEFPSKFSPKSVQKSEVQVEKKDSIVKANSKWGKFLVPATDEGSEENTNILLDSTKNRNIKIQTSAVISNEELDLMPTLKDEPRAMTKAKKQGGIDFVLDENIGDDELDALLAL